MGGRGESWQGAGETWGKGGGHAPGVLLAGKWMKDRAGELAEARRALAAGEDGAAWRALSAGPLTEELRQGRWLELAPERPIGALLAALEALARGASEEAEPALARALADPAALWVPLVHTELGRLAMAQRRWAAAEAALVAAEAAQAWPGSPADEAWHHLAVANLGRQLGRLGWLARMEGALLAMEASDAGVAHAQVLGQLLAMSQALSFGRPAEALARFARLEALAVAWPEAGPPQGHRLRHLGRALALAQQGEWAEARRACVKLPPEGPGPWRWDEALMRGSLLRLLGEREEAFEALDWAHHAMLAKGPGDAPAMGWLAEALALAWRDRREWAKAQQLHEAAALRVKSAPLHRAQCALGQGWTAFAAGELAQAEACWAEAAEGLDPVHGPGLKVRHELLAAALAQRALDEPKARGHLREGLLLAAGLGRLDGVQEAAEWAPELGALVAGAGRAAEACWRKVVQRESPGQGLVQVRCFGRFVASLEGHELQRWPRKRAKLLLLLLALHPEGLAREALIERLTPHMDETEALHQLSNAAWGLRRALEPDLAPRQASKHLLFEEGRFRLARVHSDHAAFVAAHERGLHARSLGDHEGAIAAFRLALGCVQGPFLADPWLEEAVRPELAQFRARFAEAVQCLRAWQPELGAWTEEACRRAGLPLG